MLSAAARYFSSSIGLKTLMGLSGLVWVGFIFGHMAGNMTIFVSGDLYNIYGHTIVSNKPLLYGTEIALVGALLVHFLVAIVLTKRNRAARPEAYVSSGASAEKNADLASKSMIYTGTVVLAFIIYHLITFKYGTHYETIVDGVAMRDLARLMTEVFANPLYVVGYVVCLVLLALHLSHGFQACWQSLGFRHPRYTPWIKKAAYVYTAVVICGFISQPIYVFFMR